MRPTTGGLTRPARLRDRRRVAQEVALSRRQVVRHRLHCLFLVVLPQRFQDRAVLADHFLESPRPRQRLESEDGDVIASSTSKPTSPQPKSSTFLGRSRKFPSAPDK